MSALPCEGDWNVILRHEDPTFSFNRNWTEYMDGFGDPEGDLFIGNKVYKVDT